MAASSTSRLARTDSKKELNDVELDDVLGFQVVAMDVCDGKIDLFTSATGDFTKQVKNNAIVGPASAAGRYRDDNVEGFQVETMDESVGEAGSSFPPLATSRIATWLAPRGCCGVAWL